MKIGQASQGNTQLKLNNIPSPKGGAQNNKNIGVLNNGQKPTGKIYHSIKNIFSEAMRSVKKETRTPEQISAKQNLKAMMKDLNDVASHIKTLKKNGKTLKNDLNKDINNIRKEISQRNDNKQKSIKAYHDFKKAYMEQVKPKLLQLRENRKELMQLKRTGNSVEINNKKKEIKHLSSEIYAPIKEKRTNMKKVKNAENHIIKDLKSKISHKKNTKANSEITIQKQLKSLKKTHAMMNSRLEIAKAEYAQLKGMTHV